MTKEQKQRERKSRLPEGGGPFKGFAFIVVGNDMAATELESRWAWERSENSQSQPSLADSAPAEEKNPAEQSNDSVSSFSGDSSSEREEEMDDPTQNTLKGAEKTTDSDKGALSDKSETAKGKKSATIPLTPEQASTRSGFRSLPMSVSSYSCWIRLNFGEIELNGIGLKLNIWPISAHWRNLSKRSRASAHIHLTITLGPLTKRPSLAREIGIVRIRTTENGLLDENQTEIEQRKIGEQLKIRFGHKKLLENKNKWLHPFLKLLLLKLRE